MADELSHMPVLMPGTHWENICKKVNQSTFSSALWIRSYSGRCGVQRIRDILFNGLYKFTLLTYLLIRRGKLYCGCVQSSMLHGSETWPVRKKWESLQQTEMRRWMCGIEVKDRVSSMELRERLRIEDIISVLQQNRLWWYWHALWKEDNEW